MENDMFQEGDFQKQSQEKSHENIWMLTPVNKKQI